MKQVKYRYFFILLPFSRFSKIFLFSRFLMHSNANLTLCQHFQKSSQKNLTFKQPKQKFNVIESFPKWSTKISNFRLWKAIFSYLWYLNHEKKEELEALQLSFYLLFQRQLPWWLFSFLTIWCRCLEIIWRHKSRVN